MTFDVDEQRLIYKEGNSELEGFVCRPQALPSDAKVPAVIVVHALMGITSFEEEKAVDLGRRGFIALAADVFGRGKRAKTFEEGFALITPFRDDRPGLLRRRLLAALEEVKKMKNVDQQKIAVIGFCFGGACALDMARLNCGVAAAVSFHGNYKRVPDQPKPEEQEPIKASVLICHGDADTHIPMQDCMDMMAELRARKADWQFTFYGNAKHGFMMPANKGSTRDGIGYDEKAAHRAWAAMLHTLCEQFNHPKH